MKNIPKVAIVIPCYNEELVILETAHRLNIILDDLINNEKIDVESFVYFVDDGSHDKTWNHIKNLNTDNNRFKGLNLSRNFGHQNALLAGLINTKDKADCIISMDADLQDDTKTIYEFIEKYKEGYEIVYGVRKNRTFDTFLKRLTAKVYYMLQALLGINIINNHADYRLMSNRAVSALNNFEERNLYLRGIIPLLGFKHTKVYYDREKRFAGESKYPLIKMIGFALDGITSFSTSPLRMVTFVGFFISAFAIGISIYFLYITLIIGYTVPGWASTVLPIYFLGGIQIFCSGIIGEYIGKIYKEVKSRPRYFINEEII